MKKEILSHIRTYLLESDSATKVELSERLEISFPTISKFIAQMEMNGEIISVGLDESSGGRRAKRYKYNPEYMLGLAIYLEKAETNYVIFNCLGEIKERGDVSSVLEENDLHLLTMCIERVVSDYPKINSIAIGVPGSVDNGRIFYIPGYEQFQNLDVKGFYEEHFSIPVVVENDMNAAVLGYQQNRGVKDNQSLVYLYSGQNGPGAGLLINGNVVRGNTFFAGEVSFVPQNNNQNFRQALENGPKYDDIAFSMDYQIEPISSLVASLTAIINPHTIIFCNDEVDEEIIEIIAIASSKYIPPEHLPNLTISDWRQDYLYGLQSLGINLLINETIQ
ncbi:ROK family transcriptional regulator [Psychrobacillus psychrodurans]|uniref:ROK family transcriptional regulator n=1 Tax=Psychrobacillus psychrodurans TaxID=126157 RepID=UPI0022B9B6A3|nr:ROK family transcriptional regulator [Psychrobacillus psychrodurans]MCZ8540075.1 ROK family transcriptional regulator [Psychrobacillus psychrodurans]